MIVPPKKQLETFFRIDPDLVGAVKAIASDTRRSDSEVAEMLLEKWAFGNVVIPPKPKPKRVKYFLDSSVVARLKAKAAETGRSENECAEIYLRAAVAQHLQERAVLAGVATTDPAPPKRRRSKK